MPPTLIDITNEWQDCLDLSELPHIDEVIRGVLEDPTEDNVVCMVRDIRREVLKQYEASKNE